MMRILAVDPGEKRIGIAISDPTGMIANPLMVIRHVSRPVDAATIAQIAREHQAGRIVIGQALDIDGLPTSQSRRAARLAAAVRDQTDLPVELWDESGSTHTARSARITLGVRRQKRSGHLDELAATVILQSFLDAHHAPPQPGSTETP
jgi:putative Holliday junction resolvase